MLGLVFGATTLAISAVLAAFMCGLAVGSALAARLAPRIRRPVRAYAVIEIVIGVYALAVPVLFRCVDWAYAAVWQHLQPGFYGFAFSRFILAGIVLIVPTALMGATLPVLAGAIARSSTEAATSITRLYTLNLAGAIAGTITAGFVLLPTFGVRATIWIAAAINLAIGVVAFLIDSKIAAPGKAADPDSSVAESSRESDSVRTDSSVRFWLFCALVSGFATISMQVVWSRVLSMIIGSSTYAFSIVLALFLGGLALGAYLISLKRNPELTALRRTVFWIELLTAVTLFLSIRITNAIPELLFAVGLKIGIDSWPGLLALQVAAAALLILGPAVLMGMVMPLVLLTAGNRHAKQTVELKPSDVRFVGQSYALNTIGAIAGAIATAFFLVPKTSTRYTIFFVATLSLVVAAIAYEPRRATSDRAVARSLAVGGAVVLIIAMLVFWPRLNLNVLSAGAYDSFVRVLAKSRGSAPEQKDDRPEAHRLLMYEEGRTATVSVRRDWGITSMAINGRTNASDADDMPTQIMLAQLGVLNTPRLGNALLVGFASGVTAGSILQSPIESVTCVELETAAVKSSRFFEHVNNRPLEDPRLKVIIDDARTYLKINPERYDLIISEPSHPWVPGVANLFTREFFMLTRDRLKDDGLFVEWVQTYQMSTESLRSVLATFHEVFPHVAMFRIEGAAKGKDLILLGSRAPITLDRMSERMSNSRVAADLARIGITKPEDVRAWFVCDEAQLRPAVAGAVINTDDNMHVETVAPREAFRASLDENAAWIERLRRQ